MENHRADAVASVGALERREQRERIHKAERAVLVAARNARDTALRTENEEQHAIAIIVLNGALQKLDDAARGR